MPKPSRATSRCLDEKYHRAENETQCGARTLSVRFHACLLAGKVEYDRV